MRTTTASSAVGGCKACAGGSKLGASMTRTDVTIGSGACSWMWYPSPSSGTAAGGLAGIPIAVDACADATLNVHAPTGIGWSIPALGTVSATADETHLIGPLHLPAHETGLDRDRLL
jgi:hypothetical protein